MRLRSSNRIDAGFSLSSMTDLVFLLLIFFVLTVAAAESAIGLAILIALFRNLKTIHVDDLDSLKG